MQTYPIIKYPRSIDGFLKGVNPDVYEISKPRKYKHKFSGFSYLIFGILAIGFGVFILNKISFIAIAVIVIGLISILIFIGFIQDFRKDKEKENRMFKAKMLDYQNTIKKQENASRLFNSKSTKTQFVQRRIKEEASSATSHEVENGIIATKGKSEAYFYRELQSIFGTRIIVDVTIPNQPWTFSFLPDITYCDGNLQIDIEIDEPYTYKTLQPIHYYDLDNTLHVDHERDNFFLQNRWIVVRFTERQIYQNVLGCCKIIAEIVFKITGDNTFVQKMICAEPIVSENFWTKEEAKQLARQKYRDSYNPH